MKAGSGGVVRSKPLSGWRSDSGWGAGGTTPLCPVMDGMRPLGPGQSRLLAEKTWADAKSAEITHSIGRGPAE